MKRIYMLATLIVCSLLLAAGPAWGEKSIDSLTFPSLNKFEIPKPDRQVLANGMTVYLLEDHTLPRVSFSAAIRKCGDYLEPPEKAGLAAMTGEVMRTGGTTSMAGDKIDEELEAIGAYVETGISATSGSVNAGGLSEYAEKVAGIMADVLRHPVFIEDKIDLARTSQRSEISRRNDEPFSILIREFRKLIYGADSPYARYPEYATIDAVTQKDMIDFHANYVQPNNIQLAVWGDFKKGEMLAMLKKFFGDWPEGTADIPAPPDVQYQFRSSINFAEKTDVTQSNVLLGHIGGKMGDPDYPATIVMNSVLGGSFGSRLTDEVRTNLGLAYHAEGNFSFNYEYPGFFYAFASTKLESTVKAVRAMIEQIKSMQTIPPTEREMKKAKDGWLNSYVFNFDSKGEIIGRMMTYDYYGMPPDFLQKLKEAVEKVTPQDVLAVAKKKLHPDALQILVVGKADQFDEPLSVLGTVNQLDITIPGPKGEEFAATGDQLSSGSDLLNKAAAACGGVAGFQKVTSLSIDAKVTVNTPQGAITLDMTKVDVMPDKSAQILKTPMGEQKVVFDGTTGWITAAGQSMAMPASQMDEQRKEAKRSMIWLFSHCDKLEGVKVAAKGKEDFDGKPAERLDVVSDDGAQFTLFLDPASYLPVGMKYMGETMAGPGEIVEKMSAYQPYGGIMIATKRVQEAGGMTFEIEVVKVDVNGTIDEAIFTKPSGI